MNIREYMFVELGGLCVLVLDLEEALGWGDDDFKEAFLKFVIGRFIGDTDPLRDLFLNEVIEQNLKENLYDAFSLISKVELTKWALS